MRVHVAVLSKNYLDKILLGQKTIESRFTKIRCVPHGDVDEGDSILLKYVGGPIAATAFAAKVITIEYLTTERALELVDRYREGLAFDEDFVQRALSARFATLVFLANVRPIGPLYIGKHDRRPWVVLSDQARLRFQHDWESQLWSDLALDPAYNDRN